jgi:hypothetical protein
MVHVRGLSTAETLKLRGGMRGSNLMPLCQPYALLKKKMRLFVAYHRRNIKRIHKQVVRYIEVLNIATYIWLRCFSETVVVRLLLHGIASSLLAASRFPLDEVT